MKRYLRVLLVLMSVLCLCFVAWAQNQSVMNGSATAPITFNNGGCLYRWTNTNPNIGLPATGGGDIPSFTAINAGTTPITAYITATPVNGSYAYVASSSQNNVSVIDTETGSIVATIPVGTSPFGVAVTPNFGYVYITNRGSRSVSVISTASNSVIATIPVGNSPERVTISPDGSMVYVINRSDNSVSVISTASNSIITTIRGFAQPGGSLVVSPDGKKLYVTDINGNNLYVVSTASNSITATIPITIGGAISPSIAISPDGTNLYVGGVLGHNNNLPGPVYIISTATNTVSGNITINNYYKSKGQTGVTPALAIALSKDGSLLYFSYFRDSTNIETPIPSYIAVANAITGQIIAQDIPVSSLPQGISLSADGSKVYVTGYTGVSVIGAGGSTVLYTIPLLNALAVGSFTGATHCTGNPITYAITVNPTPSSPTIIASGTTSPLLTNTGTASPSTSFTVTGYKLTAGILVSPPPGFEVSTDNITFNSTVTVGTGGDIPATTVYVRLPAADAVGSYSGNMVLGSGTTPAQNVAVSGSVSPAGSLVPNQTVYNGQLTQPVTLPGSSCIYDWSSDIPIGLSAGQGLKVPAFTAVNTGTAPITAIVKVSLSSGVFNAPVTWVLNQLTGKIWLFDGNGNNILGAFSAGSEPYAVLVNNARNKVYVTNKTSGTVTVVNILYMPPGLSFPVVATIPVGKGPEGIALSPDQATLYVANSTDGTVSVIDTKTNTVINTISLSGLNPSGLAISPDGNKLYVANSGSGYVSVLNTTSNTLINNISVGLSPQNIVISPDGSKLFVTNQGSNSVSVINTGNNNVVTIGVGSSPLGIAINRDGTRVYTANQKSNNVSVIDAISNTVITTVNAGSMPGGVAVSPNGQLVYVTNYKSNDVTVIQTSDNTVINKFDSDNLGGGGPYSATASGPSGCLTPFTYTITVLPTPPTITATGYLNPLTTSFGVPSAATSFIVSGVSLTEGILVTPPKGFEVSTDGINYSPTVIVGSAGNIAATTVYIRLADNDPVGTYLGDIVLTSGKASPVNVPTAPGIVTDAIPVIIASTVSGKMFTCAGAPSSSPNIQQFTVKAVALKGVLTATAPAGFEVSVDPNQGYAINIDINNLDAAGKSIIYVRLSAQASSSMSGSVKLTSPAATTQQVNVYGTANILPVANPVPSQTVITGAATKAIIFTGTGNNTFNWTNNKPAIGLAGYGTGNINSFTAVNTGTTPIVATITAIPVSGPLAYVANQAANSVSVVDVNTNKLIATIPVGSSPQEVLAKPDGTIIYVANHGTNNISVIDAGTNKTIATIPAGNDISGMSLSADGSQLTVFNALDGTITIINAVTNTVSAIVNQTDYGIYLPGTIYSPDGSRAYVYSGGSYSIYDTKTNKNIAGIPVATSPQGLALSADGKTIYVSEDTQNSKWVAVVDAASNKVTSIITVGSIPKGVSLSLDGATLYVANGASNTVSVINPATNQVTGTLSTDNFPTAIATTGGTGCNGVPVNFTITVNPPAPTINASGVLDALTTVYGTPSQATTFTVSGTNLTEELLITPPPGFEVSIDGVNFGPTLTIGSGGDVPPTVVYLRLGAGVPVGTYTGDVVLSSLGADNVKVPTAPVNTVLPPKQTILVSTVTGSISACQGSPSASPFVQQFKVTGKLLTGSITASSTVNFEISLNPDFGYTNNITIPNSGGNAGPKVIYVRSTASALGNITGNITLVSTGAVTKIVPVTGSVTFTPTVKPINNQVVVNGNITTAVNFTGTGNTYNWLNDTPGIGLAASGGGNIAAFTAINKGSTPITATVTVTPVSAPLAYIANSGSNTVTVINTQTSQVVSTIPVGKVPYATVVSPDGSYIYIANQSSGTVSKINAVTGQVYGIGVGDGPNGIAISPDGSQVFVANGNESTVSVISTVANGVFTTIQVGKNPQGLVVSPDGTRLYVTNRNEKVNTVYVIDLSTYTVIAKIATAQLSPESAVISPDGGTLYVSNYNSKSVSVINTVTLTVTATITVGANPLGMALSPDGNTLYVANAGSNAVSVINTVTNTVTGAGIKVGNGPQGVSVSPDGKLLYVTNALSNSVTVISTVTNTVVTTLITGGTPVSTGNFISNGMGCAGIPTTFTITVNPTVTSNISTTGNLTGLNTTYGTPSASENFTVSGTGMTGGVLITPPKGFETSTDNVTFNATTAVGKPGNFGPITVYIRLGATTPVGQYSGNIVLTNTDASTVNVLMPNSTVIPAVLTITADNKTIIFGAALPVFTPTYTGFVNGEAPSMLTNLPSFTTNATAASPAGKYPITVSGAAAANYTFIYVPGVLTITTTETTGGTITKGLVIPNTFTPNGDGINDTWNIPGLLDYTNFTVQIFNRTGQSIYYSNDYPTAWDGTYKGAYLPVGTYYYIISFTGATPIGGSVTIIR